MNRLDRTSDGPKPHEKRQVWCSAGWTFTRREGIDSRFGPLPSSPPEQAPGEGRFVWLSMQTTGVGS